MATVLVSDLTIEPKAPPPRAVAPPPQPPPKNAPQAQRDTETAVCRMRERALRLWAY